MPHSTLIEGPTGACGIPDAVAKCAGAAGCRCSSSAETSASEEAESSSKAGSDQAPQKAKVPRSPEGPEVCEVFACTSFSDRTLFAACQAGLVNDLND